MGFIKEIKEKLNEQNYYYIVAPRKKICIEMTDKEEAEAYAAIFGALVYDYFPYAEYGYKDPYTFTNAWRVFDTEARGVHYEVSYAGVEEILD